MNHHVELTERAGMTVLFAAQHSPWQLCNNENMRGLNLVRIYLKRQACRYTLRSALMQLLAT